MMKHFHQLSFNEKLFRLPLTWLLSNQLCWTMEGKAILNVAIAVPNRYSSATCFSTQTLQPLAWFKHQWMISDDEWIELKLKFEKLSIIINWKSNQIEVPLRQKSINELGQRYYEKPGRFHGKLKIAVSPDWHLSLCPEKAKPVSPPENVMAFLLPLIDVNQNNFCLFEIGLRLVDGLEILVPLKNMCWLIWGPCSGTTRMMRRPSFGRSMPWLNPGSILMYWEYLGVVGQSKNTKWD